MKKTLIIAVSMLIFLNGCRKSSEESTTENIALETTVSETVLTIQTEYDITDITTNETDDEKLSDNVYLRKDGMIYIPSETDTPEEAIEKYSENIKQSLKILNVSVPFTKDHDKNAANLAAVLNARYDTDSFYSEGHMTGCRLLEQTEVPDIIKKMEMSQTTDEYIQLQAEIYKTFKDKTNGNYDWNTYSLQELADIGAYIQGTRGHAECPSGNWEDITYTGDSDLESFKDFYNALRCTQFIVYDWVAG